ncbi:hypothetical protein, partial [Pseudomonas sp.]|uniref:hypothetical protein n=1 Tax=Pseudomonas sp. TaxID=306 RepID=UPI0032632CE6
WSDFAPGQTGELLFQQNRSIAASVDRPLRVGFSLSRQIEIEPKPDFFKVIFDSSSSFSLLPFNQDSYPL